MDEGLRREVMTFPRYKENMGNNAAAVFGGEGAKLRGPVSDSFDHLGRVGGKVAC